MGTTLNKTSYQKIVDEDIQWLESNTEDSLERRHIIDVLKWSANALYPSSGITCLQSGRTWNDVESGECHDLSCTQTYPHNKH